MLRLRSLLRRLINSTYPSLQEAIDRHIQGTGTGFEIDDIISSGHYPAEVVDRILNLSHKYRTNEYPVGISNPECFDELSLIAREYS